MRNLEEQGGCWELFDPMAKPMVTKLTKSRGAVSKAQVMGWRKGGASGTFPCTGMMSPHREGEEHRGKETEMSNGDMSPAGDLGTRMLAKHPPQHPCKPSKSMEKRGFLPFFLFLKGLTSSYWSPTVGGEDVAEDSPEIRVGGETIHHLLDAE